MRPLIARGEAVFNRRHESNRLMMRAKYHSGCIFNKESLIRNLKFRWKENGILFGAFICTRKQQGYDDMAHGGVIAAIIDASMTQCLMGHGIAGYTGELNVRYRHPVRLNAATTLQTRLVDARFDKVYQLETIVTQAKKTCVTATSKFISITQ
jgi:hypothetical protein